MKKISYIVLLLTLCLGLCACFNGIVPGLQNTEPTVTVDPNAEPEIVIDKKAINQEELSNASGQVIGYCRYTEGTNCGIPGIVLIEYLDVNGNVVQSFSPQLPGGTFSRHGDATYEYVQEKSDHGRIRYDIAPCTNGKLLESSCEVGAGMRARCTWINQYNRDGQLAFRFEASREDTSLENFPSQNGWKYIRETVTVRETDSGNSMSYPIHEWYFDNHANLVAEIIQDPVIEPYDPYMIGYCSKVEIRDLAADTLYVYEASREDARLGAQYSDYDNRLIISEQLQDHTILMHEERFLGTTTIAFREAHTYDEAGNYLSSEYVFWNGTVLTTSNGTKDEFTKLEFYSPYGSLARTVELIEGSTYMRLNFNYGSVSGDEICHITFFNEAGEEVGYDEFVSQSSIFPKK